MFQCIKKIVDFKMTTSGHIRNWFDVKYEFGERQIQFCRSYTKLVRHTFCPFKCTHVNTSSFAVVDKNNLLLDYYVFMLCTVAVHRVKFPPSHT